MAAIAYDRITCDPKILRGKPIIRGTRISVEFIMELVSSGASISDIVIAFPHLTREGVQEAVEYATNVLKTEEIILTGAGPR